MRERWRERERVKIENDEGGEVREKRIKCT